MFKLELSRFDTDRSVRDRRADSKAITYSALVYNAYSRAATSALHSL